ncbi:Protein of unknown function [Enhydrobacter aerosaccus]|uniref:DUF3300 domain-containing protein n=2 Tax=Enhydrobacter aerosaccus TaxID=225324 RepID=A0A1T4T0S5_9HYPH|nr:Protein of unknown function [Enhydrobacter aerosaccus]
MLSMTAVPAAWSQTTTGSQTNTGYSAEQLDQMLAPIALYPDALLSQVLMAATYPLEVVEAARWSQANPNLTGDAAVNAVKDKSWDVSVKSLVAFPSVLKQMNDQLDWTQKIGNAMLEQQQAVADSIQRLRAKAAAAGNLKSTPQQTVTTQGSGSNVQYVIAPANPEVIYVPSYNPSWAYGPWPYPAYPPSYFPPAVGALASGFLWGVGFAAAGAMFGGWHWGGYGNSYVNVNVNRAVNIDNHFNTANINPNGQWQHDPAHRLGVAYPNAATRAKYGQAPRLSPEQQQQFRGRLDGNAGANRPQVANRGPAGQPGGARPNAGQQREQWQNRSGADRPSAFSGVDRGQQVNREAQRGQFQLDRAQSHPEFRGGGGGGFGRGERR